MDVVRREDGDRKRRIARESSAVLLGLVVEWYG